MSRFLIIVLAAAGLLAAALFLTHSGGYGLVLFAILPTLCGVLGAAIRGATTRGKAVVAGCVACFLASLLLLLIGKEGLICIAMTVPLDLAFGSLGGLLYIWASKPERARRAMMLIPLPLVTYYGLDAIAKSPVYEVTTSIEINAPPERVWPHVTAFPDLASPDEWYFKTGLAYPTGTRITGSGVGAARYCDFSTGSAVETVTQWEPARLLEFDVHSTPAPMVEWNPIHHVEPKHLHGYMISKRGRFRLIAIAGGRTRLVGTSWYQHGLYPAFYWRLWSDALVHRIHTRVFNHIRQLSEN